MNLGYFVRGNSTLKKDRHIQARYQPVGRRSGDEGRFNSGVASKRVIVGEQRAYEKLMRETEEDFTNAPSESFLYHCIFRFEHLVKLICQTRNLLYLRARADIKLALQCLVHKDSIWLIH